MELFQLHDAHRFDELVKACQERLALDASDMEAADSLASALKALGRYAEAIRFTKWWERTSSGQGSR